jgi:TPR repeat protein
VYGCCLYREWGVKAALDKAKQYFKSAADKGSLDGNVWYWICDWENCASHFHAASKAKHPAATFLYGLCLYYGKSVPKNIKKAQKYFSLAAEYGDSYWAHQFAKINRNGIFNFDRSFTIGKKYDILAHQRQTEDISFFYPQFF